MSDDAKTNDEPIEPTPPEPEGTAGQEPEKEPTPEPEKGAEARPETEVEAEAKPEPEARPKPEPEVTPKPEKRAPSFWTRALRWTLGLLILLGLGFIAAIFVFFIPARQQVDSLQADLQAANQRVTENANASDQKIAELEKKIQDLSALETKNQSLQSELDQANLHIAILSARSDVATAQLALEKQDTSKAHAALSQTPQTLDELAKLLPENQQQLVKDMQSRLELANSEIDSNAFAAQSDLTVLATSLLELENALFG